MAAAVSGNTHFLLAPSEEDGELEDGRPVTQGRKYQAARDKEVKSVNF